MKLTRSNKILMTLGSLGVAATIAGAGTFAAFSDTEARTQSVTAGTVNITVGPDASTIGAAITNMAPGDTVQKHITLTNSGSLALADVTLNAVTVDTTASTSGGELFAGTPDATAALQVKIERCADGWLANVTTGLLECSAGAQSVLANTKAVGASGALANLDLTSGGSNDLVATFSLPGTADNGAQGDSGVLSFTLVGHQRTAQNS